MDRAVRARPARPAPFPPPAEGFPASGAVPGCAGWARRPGPGGAAHRAVRPARARRRGGPGRALPAAGLPRPAAGLLHPAVRLPHPAVGPAHPAVGPASPDRGPAPRHLTDRQRAGDVGELPGPVDLRPPVGAGGAVRQRHLHLPHPHAAAEKVDREGRLHAEPGRERPGGLKRGPGQAALAVERLGRPPSGGPLDAGPGERDDEPMAALPDPVGEDRDRHVGLAGQHRFGQRCRAGGSLAEVAVEEQQMTRPRTVVARLQQAHRLRAALHRRGLAAAAGMAHHGRPGVLGHGGGAVPGAVVHHQHEIDPGQPGGPGHGRPDAVGFVPGRDDDSHVTARHHGLILGLAGTPSGPGAVAGLLAVQPREVVVDGEDRRQAGHLQDLAHRRARRG